MKHSSQKRDKILQGRKRAKESQCTLYTQRFHYYSNINSNACCGRGQEWAGMLQTDHDHMNESVRRLRSLFYKQCKAIGNFKQRPRWGSVVFKSDNSGLLKEGRFEISAVYEKNNRIRLG